LKRFDALDREPGVGGFVGRAQLGFFGSFRKTGQPLQHRDRPDRRETTELGPDVPGARHVAPRTVSQGNLDASDLWRLVVRQEH
jgi:hypothetical protein